VHGQGATKFYIIIIIKLTRALLHMALASHGSISHGIRSRGIKHDPFLNRLDNLEEQGKAL